MNNPFTSEEWSLDQVLIWMAEQDATPWFLEARGLEDERRNSRPWFDYRCSPSERANAAVSPNDVENALLRWLRQGRLTPVVEWIARGTENLPEPNPPDPSWFVGKSLWGNSKFRAVLKSGKLAETEFGLRFKSRQVLAILVPTSGRWLVPSDDADADIIPYAEAWKLLADRMATERGVSEDEAGKLAAKELRSAILTKRLTMSGYPAPDGVPQKHERVEDVSPEEARPLRIDPVAGQPRHEYQNGRPWRAYGAAFLHDNDGPLRWTGLHFDRDQFERIFSAASTGEAIHISETVEQDLSPAPCPTKADVEAAYREWVSKHHGKPSPSRTQDEAYMSQRFPGFRVTRDRVRELRERLAPDAWKQKGRRKLAE